MPVRLIRCPGGNWVIEPKMNRKGTSTLCKFDKSHFLSLIITREKKYLHHFNSLPCKLDVTQPNGSKSSLYGLLV